MSKKHKECEEQHKKEIIAKKAKKTENFNKKKDRDRKNWLQGIEDLKVLNNCVQFTNFINSPDFKKTLFSSIQNHMTTQKITTDLFSIYKASNDNSSFIEHENKKYPIRRVLHVFVHDILKKCHVGHVFSVCKEWGSPLVIVSSHHDTCLLCSKHQGKIYSIYSNHPQYPKLPDFPFHSGCTHHLSPITESTAKRWEEENE